MPAITRGDQQEGEVRHARDQAEKADDAGDDVEHLRPAAELLQQLLVEILVGRDAGDQDAGGGRDDQRRICATRPSPMVSRV